MTGDGRGDGNSRAVSRFVPTLSIGGEFTRASARKRRTGQRGAGVSTSAGVYHNLRRTTEQSNSNHVDVLFALFVFCSFLFGNVRCVFVLVIVLKACKCAEYCTCSLCSAKKRPPLACKINQKMWSERFLNVVKNYTLGFLLPIIYIGASERVLFFIFHQCAAQGPCDRRTRALLSSVVNLNKSMFGLLCKHTKNITDLKNQVNKTPTSFRIHIGIFLAA